MLNVYSIFVKKKKNLLCTRLIDMKYSQSNNDKLIYTTGISKITTKILKVCNFFVKTCMVAKGTIVKFKNKN